MRLFIHGRRGQLVFDVLWFLWTSYWVYQHAIAHEPNLPNYISVVQIQFPTALTVSPLWLWFHTYVLRLKHWQQHLRQQAGQKQRGQNIASLSVEPAPRCRKWRWGGTLPWGWRKHSGSWGSKAMNLWVLRGDGWEVKGDPENSGVF